MTQEKLYQELSSILRFHKVKCLDNNCPLRERILLLINQHMAEVKQETANEILDRAAGELPQWLEKEIEEEYEIN